MSLANNIKQEMCIKMMYNIVTFKNVHQIAKFNNAKLQLLLYQPNMYKNILKILEMILIPSIKNSNMAFNNSYNL